MNRARLAVCLSSCVIVLATGGSAEAKLPPECVERFESKVLGHVTAIDEAMHYRARLPDIGRKLLAVRAEALGYVRGKWAADCADAAPENRDRMNKFTSDNLIPALNRIARAFRAVCTKYGKERLDERIAEANKAAAKGRPDGVDAQLSYLDTEIRRDDVLGKCTPFVETVGQQRTTTFAEAKKKALLVRAEKNLVACAVPVKTSERIAEGLADGKRGELYEIGVPNAADLERFVAGCHEAIDEVEKLSPDPSALTVPIDSGSRLLAEVKAVVADLDPAEIVDRVRAHNAKWKAWFIAKWKRENIRGGGMRKVYKAHGTDVIPRIRDLGSQIVWTYRTSYSNRPLAECEEYTFSARGALKSRRAYACR